jgi:hypothetical protein
LIAGDETSKNNGRTSNKNMNKEAQAWAGRKKREVQFVGEVTPTRTKASSIVPVGATDRDKSCSLGRCHQPGLKAGPKGPSRHRLTTEPLARDL